MGTFGVGTPRDHILRGSLSPDENRNNSMITPCLLSPHALPSKTEPSLGPICALLWLHPAVMPVFQEIMSWLCFLWHIPTLHPYFFRTEDPPVGTMVPPGALAQFPAPGNFWEWFFAHSGFLLPILETAVSSGIFCLAARVLTLRRL